jgi:hypothetical protein
MATITVARSITMCLELQHRLRSRHMRHGTWQESMQINTGMRMATWRTQRQDRCIDTAGCWPTSLAEEHRCRCRVLNEHLSWSDTRDADQTSR